MWVATGDATTEVPRYIATLPFLATILLLFVGQTFAWYISSQFGHFVSNELKKSAGILKLLPTRLGPGELQLRLEWTVDLIQAVASILTPAFGVAILLLANLEDLGVLYFLAVPVLTLVVLFLLLNMTPGKYRRLALPSKARYPLSLVTWFGVLLNSVAAVVAFAFAPATLVAS